MSWLMVAKMPLLISSRMTSAGLTPNSSASSLTVMVGGSSTAPRSRGSAVWTLPDPKAPSRRGGLRGPRRPRVPLLLLAMGSSLVDQFRDRRGEHVSEFVRDRGLEGPAQGASADRDGDAGEILADTGPPRPAPPPAAPPPPARGGAGTPRRTSCFGRDARRATRGRVGGRRP